MVLGLFRDTFDIITLLMKRPVSSIGDSRDTIASRLKRNRLYSQLEDEENTSDIDNNIIVSGSKENSILRSSQYSKEKIIENDVISGDNSSIGSENPPIRSTISISSSFSSKNSSSSASKNNPPSSTRTSLLSSKRNTLSASQNTPLSSRNGSSSIGQSRISPPCENESLDSQKINQRHRGSIVNGSISFQTRYDVVIL